MSKTSRDEQIGQNLVSIRGNMSQADLALQMRERGYKWSAATVWAIEKGERPLKLTEATDVVNILGVDLHFGIDELLDTDDVLLRPIRRRISDMRGMRRTIDDALPKLAKNAVFIATVASGLIDQLTEQNNDYLLETICSELEFASVNNIAGIGPNLVSEIGGSDSVEQWIDDNKPFSTILLGKPEDLREARKELGLETPDEE
ncbi:helix-turn-helix domain-containing protein [Bifidobacterium scardovii]|nr:hypothetical protein [Bifidobacterium scardovii]MDK6348701.1 hypothetical protein [Bifidobacterium scardovii]MDU8981321.1 hypothetical protein [Bifidobacterium scardovii]